MTKKVLSLLGVVALSLTAAWGADDPAEKAKSIVDRALGIKQYHQKTAMSMQMMGNSMKMDGEMWANGDKVRIEMTMPPANMKQVIISDGAITYTYMPMMKMVQKMDLKRIKEALGEDFAKGMGGKGPGSDVNPFQGVDTAKIAYVGAEELDGAAVDVVEGPLTIDEKMAQMSPMMPQKAKFWVSIKDGLPRKTVFFGKDGQEMLTQQFSEVTVNPEMDEALFVFTQPEGAQVMDMTDGIINMYTSMQKNPPGMPPSAPPSMVPPTAPPPSAPMMAPPSVSAPAPAVEAAPAQSAPAPAPAE